MDSEFSTRNEGERGSDFTARSLEDLRPTTSHDSKTVVLAAERGDKIEIGSPVEVFQENEIVPKSAAVVKRSSTSSPTTQPGRTHPMEAPISTI